MTWRTQRLSDVAELSLGKMLDQKKNRGVPRPYLANVNVRWGSLDLTNLREMRFEPHEKERYGLQYGDIVMCEGGEPGRCAIWREQVPGMMFQKALHRIRAKVGLDPVFLFYYLFNRGRSGGLSHLSTGATIKHLPGEQLEKVEVSVPPLPIQRRIASIIGAYDELIEVNRRRIVLLEEMARRLFEEWFVLFRFPGALHASTGADERLPADWQEAALEEMLVLQRGFDLPTGSRLPGPVPVIASTGVHGTHAEAKVRGPGVTTGRSGTIGSVLLVHEDFWPLNTVLYVRQFRKASPAYALFLLRHLDLKARAGGAAVPTLNRNHVHSLPVPCPPSGLVQRFEEKAMEWLRLVRLLEREQVTLLEARDLLLPRLVSGKLSISVAERELETAA
jgi:type I restriction enzyme, S subunit